MKVGDKIICRDKDDELKTMYDLQSAGVETEFYYDDPDEPYVLEITGIGGTYG